MPELVVAMPAYNTGRYIREAIASVLLQREVDFELVVVDDGSSDDTAEVVRSFDVNKLRLLANDENAGISHCHNQVNRDSDSRFVAHVDSDDVLLPGALAKMVQCLKADAKTHYAHCNYDLIGATGELLTHGRLRERQRYLRTRQPDMDYKRELIMRGGEAANHLRTYRKSVFDAVGGFDENMLSGGDYDMALRVVECFKIQLVPEFLYRYRIHRRNISGGGPLQTVSFLLNRRRICRKLIATRQITFTSKPEYNLRRLLLCGFFQQTLGLLTRGAS